RHIKDFLKNYKIYFSPFFSFSEVTIHTNTSIIDALNNYNYGYIKNGEKYLIVSPLEIHILSNVKIHYKETGNISDSETTSLQDIIVQFIIGKNFSYKDYILFAKRVYESEKKNEIVQQLEHLSEWLNKLYGCEYFNYNFFNIIYRAIKADNKLENDNENIKST